MSALIDRQIDCCEERLLRLPEYGIFDPEAEFDDRELFSFSYYAEENMKKPPLKKLRKMILKSAEKETAFLGAGETALLLRCLQENGRTEINDWNEIGAVEGLVKRLWCKTVRDDEGVIGLVIQEEVRDVVFKELLDIRKLLTKAAGLAVFAMVDSVLYLNGFVYADWVLKHVQVKELSEMSDDTDRLIMRALKSDYDYLVDPSGKTVLLHAALADPADVLKRVGYGAYQIPELPVPMISNGMTNELPGEKEACLALAGTIAPYIRQENNLSETIDDLKYMAKQNASLDEMKPVLQNALACLPKTDMLEALRRLWIETVRWVWLPGGVLN